MPTETLLSQSEILRTVNEPTSVIGLNLRALTPDFIAQNGRLRLFRPHRVAEIAAALASRRAHQHAVNTTGPAKEEI